MIFRCAIAAMLAIASVVAQTSKILDLSAAVSPKKFYVIFAARGGSATGHAFVLWGVEDGIHRRSTIRAFGLYPESDKNNCQSVYRRIPGTVVDESLNHGISKITDQLIVRVEESDFDRSLRIARTWECKHEFALLISDCVEFMRAVGNSLGIEMPYRFITRWTPRAYVRALLASVDAGEARLGDGAYEGSLVDGKPAGHGTLTFLDGSRIEGAFRAGGHYAGTGFLLLPGNRRYEGSIVDGLPEGRGTISRLAITDDEEGTEPVVTAIFERGQVVAIIHDYTLPPRKHGRGLQSARINSVRRAHGGWLVRGA